VNASSQTPVGALPPESPHGPRPLAGPATPTDVFAAYGAVLPVPLGTAAAAQQAAATVNPDVPHHLMARAPEPAMPECFTCGGGGPWVPCPRGRVYPSGAQVLYCRTCVPDSPTVVATAGLIGMAMEKDGATARQVARAEEEAGLLFDPKRAQAIWDAAYAQAKTEDHAEQQERGKQLAVMTDRARRLETELTERKRALAAVLRLCEGRPSTYHLSVGEIFTAASDGSTVLDNIPTTVVWVRDRGIEFPDGGAPQTRAVVPCITAYGTRADLVLNGGERQDLASLLGQEVRDPHAKCATDGCGTVDDYDASDPALFGWSRLQIATLGDEPRWYCCDMCVFDALARAGHDLAADDQAAAVDPDQQAPNLPLAEGDDVQEHADPWPPNGGHDPLCAYASGISRTCTCAEAVSAEANPAGGAL